MKTAPIAIIVIILTYLAFSFVLWDTNPANWDAATRALYIWCSFIAAFISAVEYNITK